MGLGAALIGLRAGAPIVRAQVAAVPKVTIVSPKDGDVVTGPSVHVVLTAAGVEIAPAAEHRAGTAHHNLFLDVNTTSPDSANMRLARAMEARRRHGGHRTKGRWLITHRRTSWA